MSQALALASGLGGRGTRFSRAVYNLRRKMPHPQFVDIARRQSGETLLRSVRWCSSRWCRFRGLQFRRQLRSGEAIVLVYPNESVVQTSIHMLFVFFPIGVVWIDAMGRVTETQLAKPWRPYYASPTPAQFVLEGEPELLSIISVGDELNFILAP